MLQSASSTEEVLDVADLTIIGVDMIASDCFGAAEMQIVVVSLGLGDLLFAPPAIRGEAIGIAPPSGPCRLCSRSRPCKGRNPNTGFRL